MAKKTKQDFAQIETTDAAFLQMMENLPNIDIDPYASERKLAEEEVSSSVTEMGKTNESKVTKRRSGKASQKAMTAMPISEQGRDSINMAKQLYCRCEGVKMTREEFLLLMIENSMKKMSPKAYDLWKAVIQA